MLMHGEFQYVKGSHLWSAENKNHDYTQEEIETKFSKDIIVSTQNF